MIGSPTCPPPHPQHVLALFTFSGWLRGAGVFHQPMGDRRRGVTEGMPESLCACAVLRRVCLLLTEVRRRCLPAFGPAWRPWRPGCARRPPGERPPLGAARPCCGAGRGVSATGCGRCRPGKWSGTSGTSWPGRRGT